MYQNENENVFIPVTFKHGAEVKLFFIEKEQNVYCTIGINIEISHEIKIGCLGRNCGN